MGKIHELRGEASWYVFLIPILYHAVFFKIPLLIDLQSDFNIFIQTKYAWYDKKRKEFSIQKITTENLFKTKSQINRNFKQKRNVNLNLNGVVFLNSSEKGLIFLQSSISLEEFKCSASFPPLNFQTCFLRGGS